MTSQECIQRKTDTKQETALGFILVCGESEVRVAGLSNQIYDDNENETFSSSCLPSK